LVDEPTCIKGKIMALEPNVGSEYLELTVDIVAAHVASNRVSVSDVPILIEKVHQALSGLRPNSAAETVKQQPAVSVRSSVKPDYIVCLEDGKKLRTLKRYLMSRYQMTPEQYRAKWKLPIDYPMVAPDYSEQRRELAKKMGLGANRRKPNRRQAS
jgi:predicted transcriptional regulator